MVAQLCSDQNRNYAQVNKQLDKMGYNIGMRLVEDFFAKSGTQRCANFQATAETISKVCRMSEHAGQWWSIQGFDAQLRWNELDRIQDVSEYYTHDCQLV